MSIEKLSELNHLAILINTHSSYKDIWPIIENRVSKYIRKIKIYILTNKKDSIFKNFNQIIYKEEDDFTSQFSFGLNKIYEKFIITLNDDCIITSEPKEKEICRLINILESQKEIDFIRLFKGDLKNYTNEKYYEKIYKIDNNCQHLYSQSATLWKTSKLLDLYSCAPKGFIGKKNFLNKHQQKFYLCTEDEVDKIAIKKKINGLYYFNNEKKIGHSFYDCSILPHLNSIIIGGKWNYLEYKREIIELKKEFNLTKNRGNIRFDLKTKLHSYLKKALNNE